MLIKIKKIISLSLATLLVCYLFPQAVRAASYTILYDCFSNPLDYNAQIEAEVSASDVIPGKTLTTTGHLVASGGELEANCRCPGNMSGSSDVYPTTMAGSPLPAGVSGYGYLTEYIDIDVSGYSNAIDSPDGGNLSPIQIDEYPTPLASMKAYEPVAGSGENKREDAESVCSDSTRRSDSASVKRKFKWNVITGTLYIKKPILGTETIPPTLVVQVYACLHFGNAKIACDTSSGALVSNIWLSGTLSAPLACTINAGSTIEVDLGTIARKQFVNQGQPPQEYALKDVDISYHCDSNAVGNNDRIKLTLNADQGLADGSAALIARMLGRNDVGIRIYTESSETVALDGSFEFPVAMDEQGNGVVRIKAAPVSTTSTQPEAGEFEGNITVKMDLR